MRSCRNRLSVIFAVPMFRLLTVWFAVSFSFAAQAQQWTLQQCIERALQYNLEIRQSSLNHELGEVEVTRSTAALFPSLNGQASQNYFYGRSIDPYTNTFTTSEVRSNSFSLTGGVVIFEGLQLQNTLKQSRLNYLASQNELKKVKNDISLNVVTHFLQVLYNEELLRNAKDQWDASVVQRDRMRRMEEVGSVSRGSFLELEAQVATDEVNHVQAQAAYDQSMLLLAQLLELDTVKNFSIVRPDSPMPPFAAANLDVTAVYTAALQTQPDVTAAMYRVRSSEKALSAARGGYYPRLYLSGTLSTNYSTSSKDITYLENPPLQTVSGYTSSGDTVYTFVPNLTPVISDVPFSDQWDNNLGKSVGISLQVPLFNGWAVRSNVSRAKINLEQNRLNEEIVRKNLYKSVQQAVADALASYKKHDAGERSVSALEETFKYNQQRLDLGLISTYDYLLSKNNLANARTTQLQAKYDYIFRMKILDFYLGKPLTF
jgi:outer membrane protein